MKAKKLTRRRRRNTFYREPAPSEWVLSENEWSAIESVIGYALPETARAGIQDVVSDYLFLDQTEAERVPVAEAIEYLANFKRTAARMVDLLTAEDPTRDVLRDYYCFQPDQPDLDAFAPIVKELERFVDEAAAFAESLRRGSGNEPESVTSAWHRMIRSISAIVEPIGVPGTVTKGTDKSSFRSPLVLLVMEIQELLPPERRRFHTGENGEPSYDATAGKVSEALSVRDARVPKNLS